MAKTYVGQCASAQCSGTPNSAYPLTDAQRYSVPLEILQALPDDHEICYCNWCKFVWQQPKAAMLGVEAISLGYIEDDTAIRVFKQNRHVPIRDWNLNFKRVSSGPRGRRNGPRRNTR